MVLQLIGKAKIYMLCLGLVLCCIAPTRGQEFGLSFSYFFPKGGHFSNPVSPISLRGIGLNFTEYFSVETGFTLYRMAGMNVKDLPFESNDPLMGPFFSFFVPLEGVITLGTEQLNVQLKGGVFTYYNFDNRVNYGHFDRAIANFEGLEVVNADLNFDNNFGFGVRFGSEFTFYVNKKFGITLEGYYLIGGSDLNFRGEYTGGSASTPLETVQVDYAGSKLDFTGLEISIGVVFGGR